MSTSLFKTSEGQLTLLAIILNALVVAGVIPLDTQLGKVIFAAVTVLTSLGYSVSRGLAKREERNGERKQVSGVDQKDRGSEPGRGSGGEGSDGEADANR